MPVTLKVKTENAEVRSKREEVAQRVLGHFGFCLPNSRLLCFLDDEDPATLRGIYGLANRGIYGPIHDNTPLPEWPEYVADCVYVDDGVSLTFPRVTDDLINLYGSTSDDEVGLTMTLAHEFQHAIQHCKARKLWAANGLVLNLKRQIIDALNLNWADIPTELEARIVSKRVSECLFGEQRTRQYIDRKIAERITENDAADWQFVRALTPSSSVDLAGGTLHLFERLKSYRSELESALREKASNPDFGDINLHDFFVPRG